MNPQIKILLAKKLVGIHLKMSIAQNQTGKLWGTFMPRRKEITNTISSDFYSLQVFSPNHFQDFKVTNEFEKWALVEVEDFENIPAGMESFILEEGLYAVFNYKGSSNDPSIFQYIYGSWMPNSDYSLDDRPHFEILGKKYKNNDPESEEEIWIPIKEK